MTNTLTISRELLEDLLGSAQAEAAERRSALGDFRPLVQEELDRVVRETQALLAAPVVERQEPVAVVWTYCPECGCEEIHHEEGEHKQCANCHQEWFDSVDYSEVVRKHLSGMYVDKDEKIATLTAESERLQRSNDDLSASVKYWFNAKKQSHEQAELDCDQANNTPYQPKGEWSFERCEESSIVIRNGKDWTVIKSGEGPIYEQFLYRFCEQQMKTGAISLPEPHGKQSNLKDTQYAMGWNACLDKAKEMNR